MIRFGKAGVELSQFIERDNAAGSGAFKELVECCWGFAVGPLRRKATEPLVLPCAADCRFICSRNQRVVGRAFRRREQSLPRRLTSLSSFCDSGPCLPP